MEHLKIWQSCRCFTNTPQNDWNTESLNGSFLGLNEVQLSLKYQTIMEMTFLGNVKYLFLLIMYHAPSKINKIGVGFLPLSGIIFVLFENDVQICLSMVLIIMIIIIISIYIAPFPPGAQRHFTLYIKESWKIRHNDITYKTQHNTTTKERLDP